jgi:polar amino acid transport system substrate-binding protein
LTFAGEGRLVFVADQWCPYNCEPGSDRPGLLVEMLAAAFEPEGYEVVYEVVPWARAIEETRHGRYTAILGAARLEAPDFVFHRIPAFTAVDAFYTLAQSEWVFTDLSSLTGVLLGVIRDYSYGHLFAEYIRPNQDDPDRIFMATGEVPLPRIIGMLAVGRLDVIVEDRGVMNEQLRTMAHPPDLRVAGIAAREEIFVAFSPADSRSAELAAIFDRGLLAMAADGRLAALAARYGVDEDLLAPRPAPGPAGQGVR